MNIMNDLSYSQKDLSQIWDSLTTQIFIMLEDDSVDNTQSNRVRFFKDDLIILKNFEKDFFVLPVSCCEHFSTIPVDD
jgi:hypothetical protein